MKKPKITLVGPIYPYRGGIAQYTTQIARSLGKYTELNTVSFLKQYPKFLYPSSSDKEKNVKLDTPGVDFWLSIYSPLSWRSSAKRIASSQPDLVIFCWWTLIWQPAFAWMAKYLRRRGIKTYFLCHNLYDHGPKRPSTGLSKRLLKVADGYIVHSTDQAKELKKLMPSAQILYRPLPIFDQFPDSKQELSKRGRLELLFFGFIRPYKGLDVLLKALGDLGDQEVYLTVLGEAWEDPKDLKKLVDQNKVPNVELILKYVEAKTAAKYFGRADAVVLPYRSASGSGVVSLAYNYLKPVIATEVGGLKDAVIDGKTGWLVKPASSKALAAAISKITRQAAASRDKEIIKYCQDNNWDNMAKAIIEQAVSSK